MRKRTHIFTNNTARHNSEIQTIPCFIAHIQRKPTSHHLTHSLSTTHLRKTHLQNPAFHTTNKAFVYRILPLSPEKSPTATYYNTVPI
jgi:hypothetical protein